MNDNSSDNNLKILQRIQADMSCPNLSDVQRIVKALDSALAQNTNAGILTSGISPEDANTIMKYTTWLVRRNLQKKYRQLQGDKIKTANMAGLCSLAADMAHHILQEIGLPSNSIGLTKIKESDVRFMHNIATVKVPILSTHGVQEATYLVDTTYNQFCSTHHTAKTPIANTEHTGYYLAATNEGMNLAKQLLEHGYACIDAQNAKKYLDAFNKNIPLLQGANEYLAALSDSKYDGLDRDKKELQQDFIINVPRDDQTKALIETIRTDPDSQRQRN